MRLRWLLAISASQVILTLAALAFLAGCSDDTSPPRPAEERVTIAADEPDSQPKPPASPEPDEPPVPLPPKTPSLVEVPDLGPIYRQPDRRRTPDPDRLGEAGIRRIASRRLVLFTDSIDEAVDEIPEAADDLFDDLVRYFGKLPPARDGSEFQVTGYLMTDRVRFADLGLIPRDLPPFLNGRHRGQEFWANEQQADYYRAHLALHEFTHCFMTCLPDSYGPPWYMEGMAEVFATHRPSLQADSLGGYEFAVMPQSRNGFEDWGRIRLIDEAVAAERFHTIDEVRQLPDESFLQNEPYAWSWALCYFLSQHPGYRTRFQSLGPANQRSRLEEKFNRLFIDDAEAVNDEWRLFVQNLCYGYDLQRAAIDFRQGDTLASGSTSAVEIAPDRGWQSSGVLLEAGQTYRVTAEGRFVLENEPRPWISEPQGISFDYANGRPLGRLIGTIRLPTAHGFGAGGFGSEIIDLGRESEFTAAKTGTLYLRLNDYWDSLANNSGEARVRLER